MNFASEFRKAKLPGSRWMRVNHVNPRASDPIEVSVLENTPKEVIFQAGENTSHLTWPHKLGMNVTLDQSGWNIFDDQGRKILTYSPVNDQSIAGAAQSVVDALLQDSEDEEGWIGVDFDGTLAKHTSYKGSTKLGDPIPKMVARVRRWVGHGKKVKIFTARADDEKSVNAIKKWLKTNELPDLEITNLKDQHMIEFWDDRAVSVKRNTGEIKDSLSTIAIDAIIEQVLEDDFPLHENFPGGEPPPHVISWFQNLLRTLKPVAIWGVPGTGQIYEINQQNRSVKLMKGQPNDPLGWHAKTKSVFEKLGYTMHDGTENAGADEQAFAESFLAESPEIKTLKKNARPLDPEERAKVMKAGAVWHHGPNGEATPAVRKAVVNGKTWYWCATHRFGQVRSTLAAAIKTFPAVEETS
jgi:hypothetical protein